jgi:Transposase DDE domain
MDTQIIVIYVVCEEILKALEIPDDPQAKMTQAEVMTFAIIAAKLFGGNHQHTRWMCLRLNYFSKILSASRINRRLHKIPLSVWAMIFRFLAIIFKNDDNEKEFAVDSFPITCCAKNRIDKRHLFPDKGYIGYSATKQRYFCGIKVHMIVTMRAEPIEVIIKPGAENDLSVLWKMDLDLPEGSILYADGAYTSYDLEDILLENENIRLLAKRSNQSRRSRKPEEERKISSRRQIVETAFSCITGLLPRHIRARTEKGFLIRVWSTILAYSISFMA